MAKYSRALDLVTTSIRLAQKGKMSEAARVFEAALKSKDVNQTLASLEKQQAVAFNEMKRANPTLASLFTEIAAGKKKKKSKAKAKPFGGKKAPPFKKKVKASEGDDDEQESGIDELDPVLDEMTADDFSDDSVDVLDGDDLGLEDLNDVLDDDDDGIEEMPEATAADDDSDDEEESSDDDSDDEEESSDDDSDDKEEGRVKVIASNLAALDRLRRSKVKAGSRKPAK